MEKTKHTPGPWKAKTVKALGIYANNDQQIAVVHNEMPRGGRRQDDYNIEEANARLIAAAPDLLEAAKVLISSLVWERKRSGITYAGGEMLEAAIVKAEGRE